MASGKALCAEAMVRNSSAGSNTMNYAVVWLAPAKNTGFLVTTNTASSNTPNTVDNVFGPLIVRYAQ